MTQISKLPWRMNISVATLYIAVVISSLGGLAFAAPASGDIVSGFATQYGGKRVSH